MSRSVLAAVAMLAFARPTLAQSRVFVAGDMFADLKRFSGDPSTSTLDGNGIGGGGEVGAMVAERWSIAFAVDVGSTTTRSNTQVIEILVPVPIGGIAPPALRFQTDTSTRLAAGSVLLGYHGPAAGRFRGGVFGGLTFMHVRRRFTTPQAIPLVTTILTSPTGIPVPVPTVTYALQTRETIDNVPAATVGAEAAIELTSHLAAVPEIRAHAFTLSYGGPSGFAIRPGIAIRWTF